MNSKTVLNAAMLGMMLWGCGPELAPPQERDAYLGNVQLAEVRVGRTMTGRYKVYGEVHNNGDRPLAAVLLKVDLLDKDGTSISSLTESCLSGTLAPKTKQEFMISVDDEPEAWDKKVDAKVAELGFGS